MLDQSWLLIEYEKLKEEITERVRILHFCINLAVIILGFLILFLFWLIYQGASNQLIESFLLTWSIIFALLTFNYQANQMTLEAVARYINSELKFKTEDFLQIPILGWDSFFGEYKRSQRMASFLKTLPLLLPLLIPVIILIWRNSLPQGGNQVLFWSDLVLFVLVIVNFRYKL